MLNIFKVSTVYNGCCTNYNILCIYLRNMFTHRKYPFFFCYTITLNITPPLFLVIFVFVQSIKQVDFLCLNCVLINKHGIP